MNEEECRRLCDQLRREMLCAVSKTGGHLASGLGAVELTVALHRVFDFRTDRLVFDVGHQCYAHKMLTDRAGQMDTLRQFGGLSGFPKPHESVTDAFIAGHASNSVSVALGMARARTALGEPYRIVALIGDGALTGGLAYEGLSDAGGSGEKLLVVLNDNGMSIKKNVGGIASLLERQHLKAHYLRLKERYRSLTGKHKLGSHIYRITHRMKKFIKGNIFPSTFFEEMGFEYIGPVDGHDVGELERLLRWADTLDGPVLFHVRTRKGMGYPPAEENPDLYHGVSPFSLTDGVRPTAGKPDFSAVFGETLTALAEQDSRICAVTAAMQSGTGLDRFAAAFPNRLFDVGIAEGHAVSMCAGMAKQGVLPVFAVYSSFLQRSYDMLLHDVALQRLHVVLGIDRAGLVGADGETHQGVFDLAFLSTVPHMTVLAPSSYAELRHMLRCALYEHDGPVAVRYPRGSEDSRFTGDTADTPDCVLREGSDLTLVGYGSMVGELLESADLLERDGISCAVVKINRLVPLQADSVVHSLQKTRRLAVVEEVVQPNCLGQALAQLLAERGAEPEYLLTLNAGTDFIPHGSVPQLRRLLGIDAASVAEKIREALP